MSAIKIVIKGYINISTSIYHFETWFFIFKQEY